MSLDSNRAGEKANRASISVFFPAFNDAGTIGRLVENSLSVLPQLTDNYEILVINDGSTDGTQKVLEAISASEPLVRVIRHEKNRGYGAALRSGFQHATKDLIFYTDGDGQYDVLELPQLSQLLTQEVDIVNGFKLKRADTRRRRLIGGAYNLLARLLFGLPVSDVDCDFRLIRRHALNGIELVSDSGSICVELVYKLHAAGCRFVETPVHHYPRLYGQSQFFNPRSVLRTMRDFFGLWLTMVAFRHREFSPDRNEKT
jgi:glycosyltransferase involved in cell wall biosynthesis